MDVHCSTCGEPWDVWHLRHDAIHETCLTGEEIQEWEALAQDLQLAPRWREAFVAAGYVFGRTLINVTRCPGCPKGAKPDLEKLVIKAEIEDLLAGDQDGLAATYEDHGL